LKQSALICSHGPNPEIFLVLNTKQGPLAGYEIKEYLLEKWDASALTARSRASLFRSNTSSPDPEAALNESPILLWLAKIASEQEQSYRSRIRAPEHSEARHYDLLKDAAAVNATRYAIGAALKTFGITDIVLVRWQDKVSTALSSAIRKPLD